MPLASRTDRRRPRRARAAAALTLAALAVGLAGGCAAPVAGGDDDGTFAGLPPCEGAPSISADPALYRDEPRYGNASDLTTAVADWASGQDGFEQLWLDHDHHGWIHVGFHDRDADLGALQDQLAQQFPGEGVVAVAVPHSRAELDALAQRLHDALLAADAVPTGGSALSVHEGHVALFGVPGTAAAREALTAFADEPVCVDTIAPETFTPDGPQLTAGDGWRLLGEEQDAGEASRTGVATTDAQLDALWTDAGLPGDPPAVAWATEVVVWFGAVWGGGCPLRLDAVVVEDHTVRPDLVVPGAPPNPMCNGDARPHAFVVAVERAHLPQGPFTVQLGPGTPTPGALDAVTAVGVDLSGPGASATDAGLSNLPVPEPEPVPFVRDGDPAPPVGGARYVWHDRPGCAGPTIGPLDGTLWRPADGEPAWAEPDGTEVTLQLMEPELLVVFTPGMEYLFVRAPDSRCTA